MVLDTGIVASSVKITDFGQCPYSPYGTAAGPVAVWFDAQDPATMFTDAAGTQPVTADGNVVVRWASKGSIPAFAMTVTTGTATYRPTLLKGGTMAALNFAAFQGVFSDPYVTKLNQRPGRSPRPGPA